MRPRIGGSPRELRWTFGSLRPGPVPVRSLVSIDRHCSCCGWRRRAPREPTTPVKSAGAGHGERQPSTLRGHAGSGWEGWGATDATRPAPRVRCEHPRRLSTSHAHRRSSQVAAAKTPRAAAAQLLLTTLGRPWPFRPPARTFGRGQPASCMEGRAPSRAPCGCWRRRLRTFDCYYTD